MNDEKIHILIVEDEYIIASSAQRTAERIPGVEAVIVASGQAALEHAAQAEVDVILMDIGLPGDMDGLQTAARIREFSSTPILFMSGYSDDKTRQQIAAVQNSVFISKPITQFDLKLQLEEVLQRKLAES